MTEPRGLWIGGALLAGTSVMEVRAPRTREVIGVVSCADHDQADLAVAAAYEALPAWRATGPLARANLLDAFARLLDEHADEIAQIVADEVGKPHAEAAAEVARAFEVAHYFAAEAARVWTHHLPADSLTTGSTVRGESVGVVAAITPWNFPVALVMWKLAPALAAGCTIVIKPAQETPLAAWRIAELANRVFPPGVVNLVNGDGPLLGEALATHPQVAKVAFTGSRRVAEQIAAWAAPRLKHLSLELGGHGALIVLDDADLDVAVDVAAVQGYVNTGQACYSVNRVLTTPATTGPFLERFRQRLADIPAGVMTTDRGLHRHRELLADARAHGSHVEGGDDDGHMVTPALITDARPGVRVVDEEPFTPIVVVCELPDRAAQILETNRPDYGLVNYVVGANHRQCIETAAALSSGTVVINGWRVVVPHAPYGGWHGSGLGTELGRPGLEAFVHWQHLRVLA
jgi:succinate-semialdehyde dehydrogenase/glutarate-semialdehyde dehydrogenase